MLDAFHVVKLGTQIVDEVRCRVQQATTGHRGRRGDPLFGIRRILRAGAENLTDKQLDRLTAVISVDEAHQEVYVAWRCAQDLCAAYRTKEAAKGRQRAEKILETFQTCPIAEVARLGLTLRRWREAFLAYFSTDRANNGGTDASPAATATARTTASACSWPPAASSRDPQPDVRRAGFRP